jgi:hypothetical protein
LLTIDHGHVPSNSRRTRHASILARLRHTRGVAPFYTVSRIENMRGVGPLLWFFVVSFGFGDVGEREALSACGTVLCIAGCEERRHSHEYTKPSRDSTRIFVCSSISGSCSLAIGHREKNRRVLFRAHSLPGSGTGPSYAKEGQPTSSAGRMALGAAGESVAAI